MVCNNFKFSFTFPCLVLRDLFVMRCLKNILIVIFNPGCDNHDHYCCYCYYYKISLLLLSLFSLLYKLLSNRASACLSGLHYINVPVHSHITFSIAFRSKQSKQNDKFFSSVCLLLFWCFFLTT